MPGLKLFTARRKARAEKRWKDFDRRRDTTARHPCGFVAPDAGAVGNARAGDCAAAAPERSARFEKIDQHAATQYPKGKQ